MPDTQNIVRLAAYAADPPALDALHSFDPESFVVISMINDGLVHIDIDGSIAPSLALSWERDTPVSAVFELRQGVKFHDGTPFTADDVVATFNEHIDPQNPTINGKGIWAPIKAVTKLDTYRVRFETHFPDALLLHRFFFSQIYPAHVLSSKGRQAILEHPIGTGAYELVEWVKGERILLRRNPHHFSGEAKVEYIEVPIVPQTEWIDALARDELDVAINIDAHDALRAEEAGLSVDHAPSTISHFFLLAPKGPLADKRVRQALNHAIHRDLMVEVAEHGHGTPAASLLGPQQVGHDPDLPPYRYSVDQAKRLLEEAGYPDGFTLRGLVASTSSPVYLAAKEFLSRVGVTLEAEIVPRSEWIGRYVVAPMMGGQPFDGDFAVSMVDNPTINGIFHHFIFLFSQGPFSMLSSEAYDQRFLGAATNLDPEDGLRAMRELERYVHDEALALFTVNTHAYAATRKGIDLPLPASGHFNTSVFWRMRKSPEVMPSSGYTRIADASPDAQKLLSATSHPSIFFGADRSAYTEPALQRVWDRLEASQSRWSAQLAPMMRELVSSAESKLHLANVLGTTTRVAIVGYNDAGRRLFVNAGYREMVDAEASSLEEIQVSGKGVDSWDDVRALAEEHGAWSGAVTLRGSSAEDDARLHLTATRAKDHHGAALGFTYVFSDFSGAEERVKSQAIRRIMDHVPYALFTVGPDLSVAPGYSKACDMFFVKQGDAIEGQSLAALFGFDERTTGDFESRLGQVFDDFLPEEVSIGQLPEHVHVGGKIVALTASAIRNDLDEVEGVLFSAIDVTELEAARQEIDKTRAAIAVLRDRDHFEEIALSYLETLDDLGEAEIEDDYVQAHARRELHTFKGVFGLFAQQSVVDEIHAAEDARRITADQIRALRGSFAGLLEQNHEIWQIRPGAQPDLRLSPTVLRDLVSRMHDCENVAAAQATVLDFVARALCKPAGAMVGPMAETCERLAARFDKRVRFEFSGRDVRVPEAHASFYRVMPHLLRNAIDHGLESPSARGAKTAEGTIRLSVAEDADGFTVVFGDDGRGIDADAVAKKALEVKAITPKQLDEMTPDQKLQLIFLPGLSTAAHASDVSGRGIGMGAVRNVVEELGGSMTLQSEVGVGTTLSIRLPSIAANEILGRAVGTQAA